MARRTTEERIKELEARIEAIKARDERKQARAKPETKYLLAALRNIDGALNATDDAVLRKSVDEARGIVSAGLALLGVQPKASKGRKRLSPAPRRKADSKLDADAVWSHVKKTPGQSGEQIAAEFGTDTATMRPILKKLIADGAVRTEGERRGTRYFASA